jgi:hypothetical protein
VEQPGPGVAPPTLGGGFGDAENLGGFFNFQADEVAELDEFRVPRFQRGEAIQRFVERKHAFIGKRAGNFKFVHIQVRGASSAALGLFAARAGDEKAAHGLRGGAEEVGAVLPRLRAGIDQLQPCFVDERGRLQGMAGRFMGHLARGHAAQFMVHERQQFLGRFGVALFDGGENAGDVAHGRATRGSAASRWRTLSASPSSKSAIDHTTQYPSKFPVV